MRIKNDLSKVLLVLSLSLMAGLTNAQTIVMDSVSFRSPQVVCNPDTISYFFMTGLDTAQNPDIPFSNTDIHVDLPNGYRFVNIIYTETIDTTKVPAVNINSGNPNDLIFSFNGFMLSPYTTLFELKLVIEPSCGANASKSKAFITRGGTTSPISDTISTTLIQVLEPYLIFRGTQNTKPSNSTINLNRLAIGQKFQRCFKVDYTSLISSIDEIVVRVPNKQNYFSFDWVTPGVSSTIVNDTVIYKFDASFFTTIGDGDGLLEPGESFTFCDSVTVLGNCNSQNSNVKQDYFLSWGCGGFNCQQIVVAAEGVIALLPTQIIRSARPDLDIKPNLCDTCGTGLVKYGFQIVNNTQAVLPTGGFLTDLTFELGTARWPFNIASYRVLDSTNHCFDSVRINGVTVPFTSTANAPVSISNLTSFAGTGLQDLDGDGFFNDLATGDTLVFELFGTFYANRHDTSALQYNLNGGNNDGQPYLIDAVRGALDVVFYDECGGNQKEERVLSDLYNYLNPVNSSSSILPDFFDRSSYTLNMTHGEHNFINDYDCDSAIRETIVILPKDVSLDTTRAYPFSNYPSITNDSVIHWVEKDGLNDVDTLYIYYNTKGIYVNGHSRSSSVILRYDCSGGVCPEADSLRTIHWYQNYKCYRTGTTEACYSTAMYRGKRKVRFHCDLPPQGISLRTFEMERTTFGYTDSTETTKVNRNTPGIALQAAMVADTVKVTLKGVVNNAILDSAHARFSYHTQMFRGGVKPVFRVDDVNSTVTIYDASAGTYHTFKLNAPGLFSGEFGPQQAGTGTSEDYDFQWNLSSYKDSVGGGYQFSGGLVNPATWDSVIMDIYFVVEDNTYSGDFHIDPFAQMVELPLDTATQCDIYGTLFRIKQPSLTINARPSSRYASCVSRSNVVEFRTGFQDYFPNEYKRNERVDEIRYTWDPKYFDDPDSVKITYYWRDGLGNVLYGNKFAGKTMTYTQTGNTIIIPMEKSVNINVLPEQWWYGYIDVYQTPSCAIKDSMPISLLGLKAEMDVTRFTNSSVTNQITHYDSSFSFYGGGSNLLVDIPTPFNITSSPIVASTTADSVCWDVTYTNLSFTDINNTWLDFSSDSITITSVVRIDSGAFTPKSIFTYGTNGLWIQTDTIAANDFKSFKVCGQYTSCQLDSVILTGGWNCSKYPTDPVTGYAPTDYSCEHNQQVVPIYIEELDAKLQLNIVNATPQPFNLCDSLVYDIQIANIDLTSLKDLVFSAIFPNTSNLSVYPGSTKLIWPYDGSNTTLIPIADPVRVGDSLAWDLTGQFSSSVLRDYFAPNDTNYALIRVVFNTNCIMFPDDAIKFNIQGTRGCNQVHYSRTISSDPFKVNGLSPRVNRLTDINVSIDTVEACDTATKVDLAFYNIFTKRTRGSEVLSVTLPASFDMTGVIYNTHRDSFLRSNVPTNTVTGNIRTLEWELLHGMPTDAPWIDSLSFSFSIVPVTNVTCNMDTVIEAKAFERYILFCVKDSTVPCEIIYPLTSDSEPFIVSKGDLTLTNISTVLNGCTDSLSINFSYVNQGTSIAPGTVTKFRFFADTNSNGVVDATDPVFDSIIITDSIPKGASGTISHSTIATIYTGGELCDIIVMVDSSSSCICDTSFAVLPVTLDMQLISDTLCDNDTINFNVCAGTGNYSSRTYTWYDVDGLGRQVYLSNVNSLSPTFDPPAVTTNTTFRYAVQVDRGGCTSEDTISILVKAAPLPFDVVDDTICEGDCITLTAVTPQTGITYNVYDGVGSWLGTLPYVACPTSTSTYYFEAIDSVASCGLIRDTAIITVVKKKSPGISSVVTNCGIGCVINLFDSLGGSPDTTGTWTDPSGSPFGSGHRVTFSSATHLPGIYTYTISNMPCNDTFATVTITQVTDTVAITIPEDSMFTLCPPVVSTVGTVTGMSTNCGPNHGRVSLDTVTGCVTYKPDTNYVGFDTVCIVSCNASGVCDTTVITITVTPVMDTLPVVIDEDDSTTLCPRVELTDVDSLGGTTIICGPTHGTTVVDPVTGCVKYVGGMNYVGQDTICIVICDTIAGTCDTTIVPITVVPVRDTLITTIPEDSSVTYCPPAITVVDSLGSMSTLCPPNNGTVTLDTINGCVTYKANMNFVGTDTLCIVKCDTAGVCDTTTLIVRIAPTSDTIDITIPEDSMFTLCPPVLSSVGTVTGMSTSCGPNHGRVSLDTVTGCVTYKPDTNYVGFDTICIVSCNASGVCDTTVITITVTPVMDTLPVVIDEDDSTTLCPRVELTDVDSLGGTTIICGPTHGTTVVDPVTGCVKYVGGMNYVGQDTICIVICDTIAGTCDTTIVPITVVPVRDTLITTIPEDSSVTYCPPAITVVDSLGSMDTLCPPLNGTVIFDTISGCFTYRPDTNFAGTDTLCIVKCDINGVCDTTTLIVTITPTRDTIDITIPEDSMFTLCPPVLSSVGTVTGMSTDCGPNHGRVSLDTVTGCVTYKPDTNYVGFDTVCIISCNASGVCDTTVITITVTPVMDTLPVVIDEDDSTTLCPRVELTDVDSLGGTTIICGPTHGTTVVDPVTGCVKYVGGMNYVGQDTICIVICDTIAGTCDTTIVPITVVPVRDTLITTIPEDSSVTYCPPAITVVDSLGSMDTLCPPLNGTVIFDTISGCFTYRPDTNFAGTDTLCIVKCDINGVCDTTTLIVTITPTRDTIDITIPEDSMFTLCPPVLSSVGTVTGMSTDCGPNHGRVSLDTVTGCVTYKPDTNYVGLDTVCIVSCNASGVCDTTVITITVTPVMDTLPVVIDEDDSTTLCPRVELTDVDSLGGTTIICGPTHGTTVVDPVTGCVKYVGGMNYVGQDTICIVICDTIAGTCDTTIVPITVVPVRDTLITTIPEDSSVTYCPPAITVVDSLGSMDTLCPPLNGTVIFDTISGCFTYRPDTNFAGTDTLCIVKCDINGVCDTTTLIVTITPTRDTIDITIPEDSMFTLCPPVLSSVGTVTGMSTDCGPNHGRVSLDTVTGCVTYKPDTNYVGLDTVCIVSCNASGVCDTTVITITVTPVMDTLPVVIDEDDSTTLCPRVELTDVDSLGGTTIICGPTHGTTVVDPVTGCVKYVGGMNYVGQDTICIVICDTIAGTCDTTIVPITVVPVRDTLISYVKEDSTVTICPPTITVVDSLASIDTLCPPMNGAVTLDTINGCLTYKADTNFVGFDTLCIVKCDINGVCDTTVIIMVVGPVKDTLYRTIPEDDSVTICPPVISNLGGTITGISSYCGPNNGSVQYDTVTGCVKYVAGPNYVGQDTLCVVSCDNNGNCDTTVVIITVTPVMDTVPIIIDEDSTVTICPPMTTVVGTLGSISNICPPKHGVVTTNALTGCITYDPDTNYVGLDTVCVVLCDVFGVCDTTILTITVVPVRDTFYTSIPADSTLVWCPRTDSTTDVDSLRGVTIACGPTHGTTVIDPVTGCITYTGDSTFAGNDTVCIVTTDVNGVSDTTTAIITLKRVFIPFVVADDSICEGDCVTLMADTMQTGVVYRVHSPRGTIVGRLPMVVCPTVDSTFYIEAWDSITGVVSIWDTATIFVTKFRSPGISRTIALCETGTIVNLYDSLGGAPDTTGTWNNPNSNPFGTSYLGAFNPLTDTFGVYTYTIINPVCPDTSATVTVTQYSAPDPGIGDTLNLCQNGLTQDLFNILTGTPDNTGTWSGPSPTTNGNLGTLNLMTALNGDYLYRVTKFGCADDTALVNVTIDTIEDPSITMVRTDLCKGLESAQVIVTGATGGTFAMPDAVAGDNISINPTTGLISFSGSLPSITRSGSYYVTYTTSGPCPETDSILINITTYGEGCQIEIPQFISPNADGKNDVLTIPGIEEFPNNVIRIYNRWGNLVYEKKGYDNSWNGTTNVNKGINRVLNGSDMLPVGTYFYVFESGDENYPSFTGYVYVKK